jgi:hypothetical protein
VTAASRQKMRRQRAKQGLRRYELYLPEELTRDFLLKIGWLPRQRSLDFASAEQALGSMLASMIAKYLATVTRDGHNLQTKADAVHACSKRRSDRC